MVLLCDGVLVCGGVVICDGVLICAALGFGGGGIDTRNETSEERAAPSRAGGGSSGGEKYGEIGAISLEIGVRGACGVVGVIGVIGGEGIFGDPAAPSSPSDQGLELEIIVVASTKLVRSLSSAPCVVYKYVSVLMLLKPERKIYFPIARRRLDQSSRPSRAVGGNTSRNRPISTGSAATWQDIAMRTRVDHLPRR